jgi:energy-coupling factor transport system permease protein
MQNTVKFLLFFAYTILIFSAEGWWFLVFLAVNIAVMIIVKVSLRELLRYERSFFPFILFAALFNLALGFWEDAVFLSIRLLLIGNMTQCYRKASSASDLAKAIETLCLPLKLFKIDGRDIGLMVSISLAFIPVLRRDFNTIRLALRAKGMNMTFRNAGYILKPFFSGILKRSGEIANAIRTKAYE